MIPAVTEGGRSFKGAAAYYLHDKREAGEEARSSADRVAWAETLNLATDDAERGWRMMTHTAMAQADLKAAAGIKATGRKLTKPVFAYSLSWHPDERPTRADQMKAARDTLKVMGLDAHQAIVVAHNDEPHAHVHVLVNRVHPETGVAATLSNSKLKLSGWALAYEQKQGKVRCPQRVENTQRRLQGQAVDAGRKSRTLYEAQRDAGNDNLKLEFTKTEQRQRDAQLYQAGRTLRSSHARQWGALNRTYGVVQGRLQVTTRNLKDKRAGEIKEAAKPRWRNLFQQQKRDRLNFDAAERGTLSKLWSMAFVYQAARQRNPKMDAITMLYTLLSSSQRRGVFDAAQEGERRDMATQIKREIGAEGKKIERAADKDFAKLRTEYLSQCSQLKATQDGQHQELQAMWKARNNDRRQAYAPFKQRAAGMRQGQEQGRGRNIRDDDRFRPPPKKRDPMPGPG